MVQEDERHVILVGVDGSEPGREAALAAIDLAHLLNWSLHACYIIDEVLVMDPYASLQQEVNREGEPQSREERATWLQEHGERELAWVVEQAAARGLLVETEIDFGGMPDALLQEAEKADLLALGRRGNGHVGRSEYLGHHFRTIARRTPIPLLVGGQTSGNIERLLLAYDGEEDTEQALAWAAAWQRVLPLEVAVLVVDEGAEAGWIAGLKSRVTRSPLRLDRFLVQRGDPAEQILATAAAEHADALLMGSYDHVGLIEWFTGSTLDHVLRHTDLPVFVSCGRPLPPPTRPQEDQAAPSGDRVA